MNWQDEYDRYQREVFWSHILRLLVEISAIAVIVGAVWFVLEVL